MLCTLLPSAAWGFMLLPAPLLSCPQVNDKPVCVCVLGWGPNCLMNDLIKELDHGVSKLPRGSEVDFVNMHNPHDSLGPVLQHVGPERIKVCSSPQQHHIPLASCTAVPV